MKLKHFTLLLFIASMLVACKSDEEKEESKPPQACFTFASNGGIITFDSGCSEGAASHDWDFGDNQTSISANPQHTFSAPGTYQVSLRITNSKGDTDTETKSVTIAQVCNTCTCSYMGQSSSNDYCGTLQQAQEFCNSCDSQPGPVNCNCH